MQTLKRSGYQERTTFEDVRRSCISFFHDLRPFAALQIAKLIVWRELRRRHLSDKQR